MTDQLKACPCCGMKPTIVSFRGDNPWRARVQCMACGLRTQDYFGDDVATPEEGARHFWNRRTEVKSDETVHA